MKKLLFALVYLIISTTYGQWVPLSAPNVQYFGLDFLVSGHGWVSGQSVDVYINSPEKIHTISIMNELGETLYHEYSINQASILLELTVQSGK